MLTFLTLLLLLILILLNLIILNLLISLVTLLVATIVSLVILLPILSLPFVNLSRYLSQTSTELVLRSGIEEMYASGTAVSWLYGVLEATGEATKGM